MIFFLLGRRSLIFPNFTTSLLHYGLEFFEIYGAQPSMCVKMCVQRPKYLLLLISLGRVISWFLPQCCRRAVQSAESLPTPCIDVLFSVVYLHYLPTCSPTCCTRRNHCVCVGEGEGNGEKPQTCTYYLSGGLLPCVPLNDEQNLTVYLPCHIHTYWPLRQRVASASAQRCNSVVSGLLYRKR